MEAIVSLRVNDTRSTIFHLPSSRGQMEWSSTLYILPVYDSIVIQ